MCSAINEKAAARVYPGVPGVHTPSVRSRRLIVYFWLADENASRSCGLPVTAMCVCMHGCGTLTWAGGLILLLADPG